MQPRSKANKETTTTSSVITHPQIEIGIAIKDQQGRKEERNRKKHQRSQTPAISRQRVIQDRQTDLCIYQGDALFPLLFCMVHQSDHHKEWIWSISNHLYMDEIKLYARSQQEINSLIHTTRLWMSFWLDKCEQTVSKRGKMIMTKGVDLPEDNIANVQDSYKYIGIPQANREKPLISRWERSSQCTSPAPWGGTQSERGRPRIREHQSHYRGWDN